MTKQEKIQLLKAIKAGKKSLQSAKPEKWMTIRAEGNGFLYDDVLYSKIEVDELISGLEKEVDLSIIWIRTEANQSALQGAAPLTLIIS